MSDISDASDTPGWTLPAEEALKTFTVVIDIRRRLRRIMKQDGNNSVHIAANLMKLEQFTRWDNAADFSILALPLAYDGGHDNIGQANTIAQYISTILIHKDRKHNSGEEIHFFYPRQHLESTKVKENYILRSLIQQLDFMTDIPIDKERTVWDKEALADVFVELVDATAVPNPVPIKIYIFGFTKYAEDCPDDADFLLEVLGTLHKKCSKRAKNIKVLLTHATPATMTTLDKMSEGKGHFIGMDQDTAERMMWQPLPVEPTPTEPLPAEE